MGGVDGYGEGGGDGSWIDGYMDGGRDCVVFGEGMCLERILCAVGILGQEVGDKKTSR